MNPCTPASAFTIRSAANHVNRLGWIIVGMLFGIWATTFVQSTWPPPAPEVIYSYIGRDVCVFVNRH